MSFIHYNHVILLLSIYIASHCLKGRCNTGVWSEQMQSEDKSETKLTAIFQKKDYDTRKVIKECFVVGQNKKHTSSCLLFTYSKGFFLYFFLYEYAFCILNWFFFFFFLFSNFKLTVHSKIIIQKYYCVLVML